MHTAKQIGLSMEEFYLLDPCEFMRLCGLYMAANGQPDPYGIPYIDE